MVEQEIVLLMQALARRRPSFRNEADFHDELFREIMSRWPQRKGQIKAHMQTDRMPNKTRVEPDILLDRFAIELKYVQVVDRKKPKDESAQIPYDSIWDCAKLEVLIDAGEIDAGVVIALTDYEDYWREKRRGGWARNFYLPDHGEWRRVGDHFKLAVKAGKAACNHPAIFVDDRFHIVLRHDWEYRWLIYNSTFRFMILRRKTNVVDASKLAEISRWLDQHYENRLSSIPFLSGSVRKAAMEFQSSFKRAYVRNKRGQPRDCPICQRGLLSWPD